MEWLSLHVVLGSIIKKAEHQRIDALTVVLEKTLENPLDSKEIQESILRKSVLNFYWKE